MKKVIPFTKEIDFKTMISKITSISLEHTLRVESDNLISGYFIVDGTYKMTQASQIDEEFSYKIPVDIEIDKKYDVSDITLDIDDFKYQVLDEDKLKLDISLCIDNLEEKNISDDRADDENLDNLFLEESQNIDLEIKPNDDENEDYIETTTFDDIEDNDNDICENDLCEENESSYVSTNDSNNIEIVNENTFNNSKANTSENVGSLFSSFKDSSETFKTYYVYIVKEEDTLDSILSKYKMDKDSLLEYNDLSDIKAGSKIIIPSIKYDQK